MNILSLPKFDRPREKLKRIGAKGLTNFELLALIVRTGTSDENAIEISQRLFKKYSLRTLQNAHYSDLMKRKGLGPSSVCSILAALELSRRMHKRSFIPTINTPDDVMKTISFIRRKKREYFVAVYLNARQQLIKTHVISIGTLDTSIAHPREIFEPAIKCNAASFIIAHNHPSGDPDPSHADILLTKRIYEASRIMGIQMKDHIILCKNDSMSFREQELI